MITLLEEIIKWFIIIFAEIPTKYKYWKFKSMYTNILVRLLAWTSLSQVISNQPIMSHWDTMFWWFWSGLGSPLRWRLRPYLPTLADCMLRTGKTTLLLRNLAAICPFFWRTRNKSSVVGDFTNLNRIQKTPRPRTIYWGSHEVLCSNRSCNFWNNNVHDGNYNELIPSDRFPYQSKIFNDLSISAAIFVWNLYIKVVFNIEVVLVRNNLMKITIHVI